MLGAALLCLPLSRPPSDPQDRDTPPEPLAARWKSGLELRLERIVEAAYSRCFRTFRVAGRDLVLRVPFGQNGERTGSPGFRQQIYLGGKGDPADIWSEIERLLGSPEFDSYVGRLRQPGDKVIVFNLEKRRVSVFSDAELAAVLGKGPYPGTRTRVFVLKADSGISVADVYNYLYCIGSVGLDCAGFIYNLQKAIAAAFDVDLDRRLAALFGTAVEKLPQIIGLWFFDPESSNSEKVPDTIENLRPGDAILFRGRVPGKGIWYRHSALIQSVDFEHGLIRYFQCTDWAPEEQRGVHESWVRFDPGNPKISLRSPDLEWTQIIQPTFEGETPLRYWRNDGHRYRSYQEAGGSVVVRLKIIKALVEAFQPGFYENLYLPAP